MRRWLYVSVMSLAVVTSGILLTASASKSGAAAKERGGKQKTRAKAEFVVKVDQWGPTQEEIDATIESVTKDPAVAKHLNNTQFRLITLEYIDPDNKKGKERPPDRFRAVYYDYTNERSIIALSRFSKPGEIEVSVSSFQPLPSPEEFEAALRIIESDPQLGAALRDKKLTPYPPMPPLYAPRTRLRPERVINVGLRAKNPDDPAIERDDEVVAVGLSLQTVRRFVTGAPPTSSAEPAADCSPPPPGGTSTGRGLAGQYQFAINAQDGTPLWSFLAIRPSASSGSEGSAVELRDVRYKGRLVLKRAHVPILNVLYEGNTCGPYRDWQYAENQFSADPTGGSSVAPGVRSCTVPATTVLDTDVDSGNHQGIAYYNEGDAVVLVSEMSAGWYRYVSEWRFHADGTIKPRFGMGAVQNGCTCQGHVHHVYWRLDFDIDSAAPNRILEPRGDRIFNAFPVPLEARRYRKAGVQQSWIVDNPATGNGYLIRSNLSDGSATGDAYARGDLWFLGYNPSEIDDSAVRTNTQANLDAFMNNHKLTGNDVVVWYAGHINHNSGMFNLYHDHSINGPMVAGPDLIPMKW